MTAPDYDHDNIFAKILRGEIPANRVYEDDEVLAFMDIMPRCDGHCLVIPKSPARNILDIEPETLAQIMQVAKKLSHAVMVAFDADGITIQQFNEAAGGQEVFHYHCHVIPRFEGVKTKPPGIMGDMEEIAANAQKIREALEA